MTQHGFSGHCDSYCAAILALCVLKNRKHMSSLVLRMNIWYLELMKLMESGVTYVPESC